MFEIQVHNEQKLLDVPIQLIDEALKRTFNFARILECHVNVILLDNHQIHDFNRKFLEHDEPTDAITFTLHEHQEPLIYVEGEILVSTEMAIMCAPDFDWSPLEELLFYVIHGGLHLCGYDDQDQHARDRMHELQHQILKQLNLTMH